ncbi:hypothetical protein HBB16_08895 [Pseudonocardia sp. MCCB 268]|nr:hypothetical protein [Pseudonocardia cytotoxica]
MGAEGPADRRGGLHRLGRAGAGRWGRHRSGPPHGIPFFGELGSLNPALVTGEAVTERAEEIAAGFVDSSPWAAASSGTKLGVLLPGRPGLGCRRASRSAGGQKPAARCSPTRSPTGTPTAWRSSRRHLRSRCWSRQHRRGRPGRERVPVRAAHLCAGAGGPPRAAARRGVRVRWRSS